MRLLYNPYEGVNWATTLRLKSQFHDHLKTLTRLQAYDSAGYDAYSYSNYNGTEIINAAYWYEDRWHPVPTYIDAVDWDALAPAVLFPCDEQVAAAHHWTAPFMVDRIEYKATPVGPDDYTDLATGMALCRKHGGLPILAHPIETGGVITDTGQHAMEIFNGYYHANDPSKNVIMRANWDTLLADNPRIYGISVNDHFGPDAQAPDTPDDHGKQIVLCAEQTYDSFRDAFKRGAMFAVVDLGSPLGNYPTINSIIIFGTTITIDTTDTVTWISNGGLTVGTGTSFDYSTLHATATYLRAEVSNIDGSTVYLQPFTMATEAVIDQVTDGLQLHLKLDEAGGTVAKDSSPNDHTCTLTSMDFATDSVAGQFNHALTFTADPDRITCTMDSTTDFSGDVDDFTLAAWVHRNSTGTYDIVIKRGITSFVSGDHQYMLGITTSGAVWFVVAGASLTAGAFGAGETHHIAGRCKAGVMQIYIDGVAVGSTQSAGTWSLTETHLLIGTPKASGSGSWTMDGWIDDIRIYDRALDVEEIALLYSGPYAAKKYLPSRSSVNLGISI